MNLNTKLYYINLTANIDRNNDMKNMINKYQFNNSTRIDAVNTKTIQKVNNYKHLIEPSAYNTLLQNIKNNSRKNHYELTKGSIGCYLSHMNIYKDIIKNNDPFALIFEDDNLIRINKNDFWKILNNIDIPENTDILLFNSLIFDKYSNIKNNRYQQLKKINFFLCLNSYLITLNGAKKLLENLFPITMQIDSVISRMAFNKQLNIYNYSEHKVCIQNNNFATNIQSLSCKNCNIYREIYDHINNSIENFDGDKNEKKYKNNNNTNICSNNTIIILLILFVIFCYFKKDILLKKKI
jgi:GR25 family glycosyltransferase involved in LPS biosynthesis